MPLIVLFEWSPPPNTILCPGWGGTNPWNLLIFESFSKYARQVQRVAILCSFESVHLLNSDCVSISLGIGILQIFLTLHPTVSPPSPCDLISSLNKVKESWWLKLPTTFHCRCSCCRIGYRHPPFTLLNPAGGANFII